jgi:hypothetical protein
MSTVSVVSEIRATIFAVRCPPPHPTPDTRAAEFSAGTPRGMIRGRACGVRRGTGGIVVE